MIKRFAGYYKPHRKLFFWDLFAAFFLSAVDLIFPIFSKTIINDYIPNQKIDMMLKVALFMLFLYILRTGAQFFMSYWGHIVGSRIEYDMRAKLFEHIQTLPFKFFDENKTGQIMSRLIGDLREISELAHHGPEDIFISAIMLIGSFIILMFINVYLTLIVFFIVIVLITFAYWRRSEMMNASRGVRRKHASINAKLENSISGIRLAKSFANESYEIERFEEFNRAHLESRNYFYYAMAIFTSGSGLLVDILSVVVVVGGGLFLYHGYIDNGELVAYLLYTTHFMKPVRRLIQFTQQYNTGMAGFERYLEVLDIEPDIKDKEGAIELTDVKGNISFNEVTFSYGDEDTNVLKEFSLKIEPGKRVALVGPSGVGKTTISKLIPRFYDVTGGFISIDGYDIRDLTLKSIRKNIGMVQQDVFMFYGTIRDNILYGRTNASEEEIRWAAKMANIHEFIISLPEGYDTIVGERGIKLSGGQKQRIAIARVFLKNPPMLILDEATSSLDNENERAIQLALSGLSEGRTTLTIAHRLSTIVNSDEILVLSNEGIIERGSHEELLNRKGYYSNLYNAQFKGYIPDEI